MHANIVRWRLDPSVQAPTAYAKFLSSVSHRNVPILRQFGLLDSFVFRISSDVVLFINIFENQADAETAWSEVPKSLSEALDGKVELIERISAAADDLPLLSESVGQS